MAWTAPSTWVSGAILTAAQLNTQLRDNMLAGGPIYTNEAARDAAITSPFEGQRAYLTAPTVPAATGDTTAVPTGVVTIYNGTVWVCTTPVASRTTAAGTLTSTTYTATLSGSPGTNPTVTLVTGTTALISFNATSANSSTGIGNLISVAVSGATTRAATDDECTVYDIATANYNMSLGNTFVLTGLTAGTNTFAINYRVTGGTGTVRRRSLTVQGIA